MKSENYNLKFLENFLIDIIEKKKLYDKYFLSWILLKNGKNDFSFIFLGVILNLGCFVYDCYFLYLEYRYREKYSWVINNIDNDNFLFNLDPYEEEMLNKPVLWKDILLSKSILVFYFLPLGILLILG